MKRRRLFTQYFEASVYFITDIHLSDPLVPNLTDPPMMFDTVPRKFNSFIKQVNTDKPDVVIALGDLLQGINGSYETFMSYWNQITQPKYLVPGNHDYTAYTQNNCAPLSPMEFVAQKTGYSSNPINAGSRFNYTFSKTIKGISIRFVMVDTNIEPDGTFKQNQIGYFSQDLLSWLQSVMTCSEKVIFICTHKGGSSIQSADWINLCNLVSNIITNSPGTKVYYCYGHSHPNSFSEKIISPGFKCINFPAFVDLSIGRYYKAYIGKNGDVTFLLGTT